MSLCLPATVIILGALWGLFSIGGVVPDGYGYGYERYAITGLSKVLISAMTGAFLVFAILRMRLRLRQKPEQEIRRWQRLSLVLLLTSVLLASYLDAGPLPPPFEAYWNASFSLVSWVLVASAHFAQILVRTGLHALRTSRVPGTSQTNLPLQAGSAPDENLSTLHEVECRLYGRAQRLRFESRIATVLIVLAMIGGLTIFLRAQDYSSLDMENTRQKLQSVVQAGAQLHSEIEGALLNLKNINQETDSKILLADLEQFRDNLREQGDGSAIHRLADSVDALPRSLEPPSAPAQISELSIRAGSVLLILFLVQLLMSVYRHATQASAFYDTRADALCHARVTGGADKLPPEILLGAETIGFGKEPSSPLDHVHGILSGASRRSGD